MAEVGVENDEEKNKDHEWQNRENRKRNPLFLCVTVMNCEVIAYEKAENHTGKIYVDVFSGKGRDG